MLSSTADLAQKLLINLGFEPDPWQLDVLPGRCPNLLAEAGLYRYSTEETDRRSETPVDDHNHALAALRYLVSKLDSHRMARVANARPTEETPTTQSAPIPVKRRKWLSVYNDFLWNTDA
jgi:hypothetical protein